jgi:hypothetical protein
MRPAQRLGDLAWTYAHREGLRVEVAVEDRTKEAALVAQNAP